VAGTQTKIVKKFLSKLWGFDPRFWGGSGGGGGVPKDCPFSVKDASA